MMSTPVDFGYLSTYMIAPPSGATLASHAYLFRASASEHPEEFSLWAKTIIGERDSKSFTESGISRRVATWQTTFEKKQRECYIGSSLLKVNQQIVVGSLEYATAATVFAGPVAALATAGVTWGVDKLFDYTIEKFDDACSKKVRVNLGKQMQEMGITHDEADLLSRQVESGDLTFEALEKKLLGGGSEERLLNGIDPEAREAAKRYLHAEVKKSAKDLGDVWREGSSAGGIDNALINKSLKAMSVYQERTDAALGALGAKTAEMNSELKRLALHQQRTADDVQMLIEVQYSQMTTAQKRALLAQRDGTGKPLYFPAMKNREWTEQTLKIQDEVVDKAAVVFNGAGQLLGAMGNFIDIDPRLSKFVAVGGALVGTATAFLSGNYLGALGSLSNLFGKKQPDPAHQRHEQIMKAFEGVFKHLEVIDVKLGQINAKLDALAQNQQAILSTIQQLGTEIFKGFDEIVKEIYRLKGEIFYNRYMLLEAIAKEPKRAQKLLEFLMVGDRYDFENSEFASYLGLSLAAAELGSYYQSAVNGLRDVTTGTNVSALFMMDSYTPSTSSPEQLRNLSYQERLYGPSYDLLCRLEGSKNFSPERLAALMRPPLHYEDLAENDKVFREEIVGDTVSLLRTSIEFATSTNLARAVAPPAVADFARDVARFHSIIPLVQNDVQVIPHTPESLASNRKPREEGLHFVKGMMKRLDLAIAQISIIAGGGILQAVHTLYTTQDTALFSRLAGAWNGFQEEENHTKLENLMHANPWLRKNLAIALVRAALPLNSDLGNFDLSYPLGVEAVQGAFSKGSDQSWLIEAGAVDLTGGATYLATVSRTFNGITVSFPKIQLPIPRLVILKDVYFKEILCTTAGCQKRDCKDETHNRIESSRPPFRFPNLAYPEDLSNLFDAKSHLAAAYATYTSFELMQKRHLLTFAAELAIKAAKDQGARYKKPKNDEV